MITHIAQITGKLCWILKEQFVCLADGSTAARSASHSQGTLACTRNIVRLWLECIWCVPRNLFRKHEKRSIKIISVSRYLIVLLTNTEQNRIVLTSTPMLKLKYHRWCNMYENEEIVCLIWCQLHHWLYAQLFAYNLGYIIRHRKHTFR